MLVRDKGLDDIAFSFLQMIYNIGFLRGIVRERKG